MQTITIGLLGLGTVGGGVVKLLQEHVAKIEQTTNVHFVLKRVAVAHLDKARNVTLPDDTILTDQLDEVLNDPEIQVIVETMGTVSYTHLEFLYPQSHSQFYQQGIPCRQHVEQMME